MAKALVVIPKGWQGTISEIPAGNFIIPVETVPAIHLNSKRKDAVYDSNGERVTIAEDVMCQPVELVWEDV